MASFAKQCARSILAAINDSDGTNEKSEGLARLAESYKLVNLDVPDVFTHVQLVRVIRNLGNEDPDIVVNCLDLEATLQAACGVAFSGFQSQSGLVRRSKPHWFRSNTTLCWRDGDLRSFQRHFRAMHGTEASAMAQRCATTAQNTATMEASNSRRSVKP